MFSTKLTLSLDEENNNDVLDLNISSNLTSTELKDEEVTNLSKSDCSTTFKTSLQLGTEVLVYCQNFNRMKSASKMKEIHSRILTCPYTVILATETSWDETVNSEEVFGNNYDVFRNDRDCQTSEKKSGGGVLIAVSTLFSAEIIETTKFKEFEHVWVKVHIAGETHVFVSVYFPPKNARKIVYEKFYNIVEHVIGGFPPETKVHIYGDFNQRDIDFFPDVDNESILLPIFGENEALQFICDTSASLGLNHINHVKNQQNCYLDLLMTNTDEDFCVVESLTPLWKNELFHTAIEFSLFVHGNNRPKDCDFEEVHDYRSANYDNIRQKINQVSWQNVLRNEENVESAVKMFYKILNDIIHDDIPLIKRRRNHNSKYPIWFSREIKNLKNRKQKAHKIYKKCKNDANLINYLNICDQLNLAIDTAFEEYNERTERELKSCPKNFFNYVKTKTKSNNFPSEMHLDDKIGVNPEESCNLFATFFQDVYTTYSENNRDREYFSFLPEIPNDICVNQIKVHDIVDALKSLDVSKGAGPDGIPPVFLKMLSIELASPLFWLYNMSLQSGSFPETWKSSFLVPIFKSGKKSDIRNYRGIAIISCIPKIFEAIINKILFDMVKNRITHTQHGFFKGRSTCTNLLEFIHYSLTAMDNGNHVEALYTDFSKAFDRIDIPMLLFKLEKIGFQPDLLKWVESYLTNRQQIVRYKGVKSIPIKVTSGVPQGSHLGPLFFILYVNDISFILKKVKALIYADDMKLFLEIVNDEDIHTFQNEIDMFYKWCNKSLLQLNVKKCNSISFSRKRSIPNTTVYLGNQLVEKCVRIRDLGVILDSKVTFIDHYNTIINKANKMLAFIKRFSYNFHDPYTIKTLYITYVRSILEYCSIVWSPFSSTHENRIESVQKQFLLFALRKLGWTRLPLPSYEARCMLINIQTLKKRREFAMVSFVNDIVSHRIDSMTLLSKLNFYAPSRQLRSRSIFYTNHHRTNYAKFEPLNQIMSVYNKHCETIDFTMTKSELKQKFMSYQNSN